MLAARGWYAIAPCHFTQHIEDQPNSVTVTKRACGVVNATEIAVRNNDFIRASPLDSSATLAGGFGYHFTAFFRGTLELLAELKN
jgi:hypothetical protein